MRGGCSTFAKPRLVGAVVYWREGGFTSVLLEWVTVASRHITWAKGIGMLPAETRQERAAAFSPDLLLSVAGTRRFRSSVL